MNLRTRRVMLLLLLVLVMAACDRPAESRDTAITPSAGEPQVVEAPAENAPAENTPTENSAGENQSAAQTTQMPARKVTPLKMTARQTRPRPQRQLSRTVAPTPTPDPTSGRVVLWHSYAGADGDALAAGLAALAQVYPELTVETLFVAYDDLPQAYADAVLAGGGPDLIAAPTWWLTQMVDAGVVQPLDALVDPALATQYFPAALENLTRNGALYGLPLTYELVSLYVNSSLVDPAALPTTTADLLTLAAAGPTTGLRHLRQSVPPGVGAARLRRMLLDENGVAVLDQGSGTADFLAWLKALDTTEGAYVDQDYGMLLDRFKKGEFAFFVDGPWAAAELRAALGDALTVTPLPEGPTGAAQPWLSADGVLLNPNKDAAQQQRALAGRYGTDRQCKRGAVGANRPASARQPRGAHG